MVFLTLSAYGQVYNVTTFSTKDGLSQSQVIAILEDDKGYLWLGTHRGVDRFDGITFKNYQEDLSGNFISDLLEDSQGRIWIATENGLDIFNGLTLNSLSDRKEMYDGGYSALEEDSHGNIWIGSNGHGIWYFQKDSFYHNPFQGDKWLSQANILDFCYDSNERLWIGAQEGLFLKESDGKIEKYTGFPGPINCLFEDSKGNIWMGTNTGVTSFNPNDNSPNSYYILDGETFSDPRVFTIIEDESENIWVGTGNGIGKLDREQNKILAFQPENESLSIKITSSILDREGNIWFGTDGGGLRRITEGTFESYAGKKVLPSNIAKSFLEDKQGQIWISTKDRGISVLRNGKKVQTLTEKDGLGGKGICSSFEDSRGNFWFASYNGTLTRYSGGIFTVFDEKDGLDCNAVYWVIEEENDRLWIGTDKGLYSFKNDKITLEFNQNDGLPSETIYSILPAGDGTLWIGTKQGLAKLKDGKISIFEDEDAIGNNVITLVEDSFGREWVGSSKGLACIIAGKAHWIKISGTAGAHTIVSLMIEKDKYLWVGTENGAYRLSLPDFDPTKPKNTFEHYIEKDGLLSKECNANALFLDSNGGVWIGTSEGASHRPFLTRSMQFQYPPALYITKILGKEPHEWIETYELDSMNLPQNLTLPFTQTRVDFEFIGISLKSPDQVEYRFKLDGVDKDWQKPTHGNSVFYPNLGPGNYEFIITAKRETEPWNYSYTKSFSFYIEPPFWQKPFFQILGFLILASIAFLWYRNSATQRRQKEEERKIRNTAEKLQLEHQALYAMMNPHFTFNALQSIQNFIQRNDKKAAHKFLSSFAKLVRKNLDSTKLDYISLGEEIDRLKLYMGLEKMRFPEKFDYKVSIDPEIDLSETKIPPMVLQPFVENSIKHGIMSLEKDGIIEITLIQKDEDYLSIEIRDNGIGIEASRNMRRNRPSDHVSKGMKITKDRLALFARMTEKEYFLDIREEKSPNGEVEGTVVEMTLPMHVGPLEFSF
ncbi:MAG: histidine kinase [Bacteroidia bacterium]|nr:histidine kinase [Bacteroidia bacterium]